MHVQSPPYSSLPYARSLQSTTAASRARTSAGIGLAPQESRWGWPEAFIALQLLWGVVFFVPGAQSYRTYLRAMPYIISGASLLYYFRRATGEPLPAASKWLLASAVLLLVNLLHPTTHLMAGFGQIVFQICIAAPLFWMGRAVRDERRLTTLVWVVFGSSFLASAVGILQVYFPSRFLPPEFSVLALSLNPDIVSSLTYASADGGTVIRPPGLSDLPGGAAVAGMVTMVLGLTLAIRSDQRWLQKVTCVAAAAIGMTTLLLTQVRSLSLLAVAAVIVAAVLRFRQGRAMDGAAGAAAAVVVLIGAWVWATSVGGGSVAERFLGLLDAGIFRTFDENRGLFVRYTLNELVYEFPLGAGVGRWGMMQLLFGDSTMWQAPPIHVEIQPTGWLLDGGVPMLLLSFGALWVSFRQSYRLVIGTSVSHVQDLAIALFCVQVSIAALCLSGPAFNTQLGIQFWAITGALFGAMSPVAQIRQRFPSHA
jgi:hypothetical protein